jgi:hypothetical protein
MMLGRIKQAYQMAIQSKGFQLMQLHTLVLCYSCNLKAASVYLTDDLRIAYRQRSRKLRFCVQLLIPDEDLAFPDTAALSEKDRMLPEVEAKSLITYQARKEIVHPVEHF